MCACALWRADRPRDQPTQVVEDVEEELGPELTALTAAQRSATLLYRYADDAETVLKALKVPYWGWRLAVLCIRHG